MLTLHVKARVLHRSPAASAALTSVVSRLAGWRERDAGAAFLASSSASDHCDYYKRNSALLYSLDMNQKGNKLFFHVDFNGFYRLEVCTGGCP